MDKTKVMVFNTTQAWVTRLEPEFFLIEEYVAYTLSYAHIGVTFTRPRLSLCSIFLGILFTPTLLYGAETWEPNHHKANNWED